VRFASTGEAGGGGALRSSVTEGEVARVHQLALADAEAFADVVDIRVDDLRSCCGRRARSRAGVSACRPSLLRAGRLRAQRRADASRCGGKLVARARSRGGLRRARAARRNRSRMLRLAWDAVAAFRALVIAKMISVQKLSITPIMAGTSRSSHRGKLQRFMGAIVSALGGRPICVAVSRMFLRASG